MSHTNFFHKRELRPNVNKKKGFLEWFCEYEKYDGGDVFLGDDRKTRIVGCGGR